MQRKTKIQSLSTILGGIIMIKCKTIKEFTLKKFKELKNIERANDVYVEGKLYVGDTFECNKDMVDYLLGDNPKNETVIEVIEVIPEEEPKYEEDPMTGKVKIEPVKPKKEVKKTTKKKSKKK